MNAERAGGHHDFIIIFERSWRPRELPEDCKNSNVIPVFNKGKKENPWNYWSFSLSSIPGKVMVHLILEAIFTHRRNKKFIQLTNIIIFYKETTNWMHEGRAVDIVYLDFSKASGCLSCSPHRQIQEVWVGGVKRDVGGMNRVNGEIHWLRTV